MVARLTQGDTASAELWLYRAGEPGRLVKTLRIDLDWLGMMAAEDGCHVNQALQLSDGRRPGRDGMSIGMSLQPTEPLCHDDTFTVVLSPPVGQSPQVQLWSMARTGESWLLWQSADALPDGRLSERMVLTMKASHVPEFGDELMVAIAAPADVTMPAGVPGCRQGSLEGLSADIAITTTHGTLSRKRTL